MTSKHRRMPPNLGYTTGICRTGKRSYFTRAGARKAAKAHHHIGHIPFAVRRGAQTQAEWRATR